MDYQAPPTINFECGSLHFAGYKNPEILGLDSGSYLAREAQANLAKAASNANNTWRAGTTFEIDTRGYAVKPIWGNYAKNIGIKSITSCLHTF